MTLDHTFEHKLYSSIKYTLVMVWTYDYLHLGERSRFLLKHTTAYKTLKLEFLNHQHKFKAKKL